jgi:hypothetical protein
MTCRTAADATRSDVLAAMHADHAAKQRGK